ncbi:MAG: nucleotidyltransferase [Roseburia sp.]|jgi:nucleotidyltransferase substrate binding protein (TIGR01987 family)|nr:nucleotidyltransferase [Roseburia sp.]
MRRFDEYCRHLKVLQRAWQEDLSNEFIVSGIIDKFFIQFELGWKVLKNLLSYEGSPVGKTGSPREVIREAYRYFGFMDEEIWLGMLKERNDTAHIYDGEAAQRLAGKIIKEYTGEFEIMRTNIRERYGKQLDEMT